MDNVTLIIVSIIVTILITLMIFYPPYLKGKNWQKANELEYYKCFSKIQLPGNVSEVVANRGFSTILLRGKQYVWIEDECICFFPHVSTTNKDNFLIDEIIYDKFLEFKKIEIRIDEIEYFGYSVSTRVDKEITGGGGGGSSISGALIGYAVAGSTGAIIASRKKNDPISYKTTFHKHEWTTLICKYLNQPAFLSFDVESISVFNRLIPEKSELNYLKLKEKKEKETNLIKKLEELKKLKELEIISESDYLLRKNALLAENKLQ